MRVLIVTQYFWPENFRINDVALGLRDRGHEVTVFTGKPNYPEGRFFTGYGFLRRPLEDYQGIRVIRAPLIPRGRGGPKGLFLNYFSFALFASLVAPFRCRGTYDAILVYEPSPITVGVPALVLKWIKRAPLLFWVQDLWPEALSATSVDLPKWILKLVERLVRFIYRHCDRILVQSLAFTEPIRRQGVPGGKIAYVPNSAEDFYQPVTLAADSPEIRELPEGFRIIFAGNVGAAQNFPTILGAAHILRSEPQVQWIIIGDGRLRKWVGEQLKVRNLTGKVHLLGSRPSHQMSGYFSLADVLLVTLRRETLYSLTIPSKIQSYLACGRPIVASMAGEGARVIEEAGAGYTAAPEDPVALARAIRRMMDLSPSERSAMGARGLAYFNRHFHRERLLDRLEEEMRGVIKAAP